jgi:hypothetical protein
MHFKSNNGGLNDLQNLENSILQRVSSEPKIPMRQDTVAAMAVCEYVFGKAWIETRLEDALYQEDLNSLIKQNKILRLADYTYLLKESKNFDRVIKALRGKQFEDAFWELYSAHLFFIAGNNVEFVKQTGVKGADFDLKVLSPQGRTFNIECKNRTSETVDGDTIFNTIDKGYKQFSWDDYDNVLHIQINEHLLTASLINDLHAYLFSKERLKMLMFTTWSWSHHSINNQPAVYGFPKHLKLSVQADADELTTTSPTDEDIPNPSFTKLYR